MFDFLRRSAPLWRHAAFNRLWAAQSISAFGNRITRTALPIIAVTLLAAGPSQAALLAALSLAPIMLAGLFGGGFVERSNKLRLMVAMDLVRFAALIIVPIAFLLHALSFPLLCVLAAVTSFAGALFTNADVSILPRLVGKEETVAANSRLQATESLAELTGPGVAGVLIDVLTAPLAILADALSFLWSAFWLFRISKDAGSPTAPAADQPPDQTPPLARLRDDFVIGFRATVTRPPLLAIMAALGVFYLAAGAFGALFMLFMLRELGLTPSIIGLIISVGGISALLGSFAARPLASHLGYGRAIALSFAVALAGLLMLIPAAYAGRWAGIFLVGQQLLGDAGFMVFTILSTSLSQTLLPEDKIARANGFNQVVSSVMMTISILGAGAIAEAVGVKNTIVWAAGFGLVGLLPLLTPAILTLKHETDAAI